MTTIVVQIGSSITSAAMYDLSTKFGTSVEGRDTTPFRPCRAARILGRSLLSTWVLNASDADAYRGGNRSRA